MNTSSNKTKFTTAIASILLAATLVMAGPLKEGDAFPDLAAIGLEGSLPDIKGKVVLVDFFASWCSPCKQSFPAMQELQKKYAGKGLVILAINVDKKKSDMDNFLKVRPVDFTILRDTGDTLVNQIKIPSMPTSFLLSREGKVVSVHRGFQGEETRRKYMKEIDALLK